MKRKVEEEDEFNNIKRIKEDIVKEDKEEKEEKEERVIGEYKIGDFNYRIFRDGFTNPKDVEYDCDVIGCEFFDSCRIQYPEPYCETNCSTMFGQVPLFCCYYCGLHNESYLKQWNSTKEIDEFLYHEGHRSCVFCLDSYNSNYPITCYNKKEISITDQTILSLTPLLSLFSSTH